MSEHRVTDATEAAALVERLEEQGVRTVMIGGPDTPGMMRGKRFPVAQLPRILADGMVLCNVFWVIPLDESDLVQRPMGHVGYFPTEQNGYPDIIGIPDLRTARNVPWHADTALLLCDWELPHGAGPVPIAPRTALKSVIAKASEAGYTALSALELEFYLLNEPIGTEHKKRAADLIPLQDRPSTYGVVLGSHQESLAGLIREQMLAYGLPIEACNPETGPGQFEINLHYAESLAAADDAFLFKSAVKEVAAQQGLLATFMAKPNSAWAGNSAHLHMSLRDGDGRGVFFDADAPNGVSTTMRHFIGGVLATMADFTSLMAPTANSYRRYVPYSWAGNTATWGIDNRSCGVRALIEGPQGTRIEQRQAGGDVNPYLATAAVLAGGLHGIEHGIEPGEPADDDVYARPFDARIANPRSLADALDRLEQSEIARRWFTDDLINHFVVMRRAELDDQSRFVTDWEVDRYLESL
jgi:glutamine synthetase